MTFWRAQERARAGGGKLILRIEDLDLARCRRVSRVIVLRLAKRNCCRRDAANRGRDDRATQSKHRRVHRQHGDHAGEESNERDGRSGENYIASWIPIFCALPEW